MSTDQRAGTLTQTTAACVHHLFEAQAESNPNAIALVMRDYELTYREVDERANQMARHLVDLGIAPGDAIVLYAARSEETIISILAVLKAGAFYVPVAADSPVERLHHVIEDAGAKLVLTQTRLTGSLPQDCPHFVLDDIQQLREIRLLSTQRVELPQSEVHSDQLCQVIYTSGTTGAPKGTMTAHRNVIAFVRSFNELCGLTEDDRVYQGFSLTFDGSIEEIWMAFAHGAALVPGPPEYAKLGNETARYLTEKRVTFFSTVPTFLSMIQEDLPTVRILVSGGEACPPTLVERWADGERRMLNVYGPTEATVNSTVWECQPGCPVTIGTAMPDYSTYVLDENAQPVEPGTPGELYVGGVGVALGYLNRPDMTERHFLPDPFSDLPTHHTMYRTGDLVQETERGELIFLGRVDQQVKIRGFRIELEEIESVLATLDGIRSAGVRVWQRGAVTELAAFVEPDANNGIDSRRGAILKALQQQLPEYMIPAWLDVLPQLPRLESGKLNRRLLPDPNTPLVNTDRKIESAKTETEKRIAAICEDVFEISPISMEDDLFLDLGGDSLLAALLSSQLEFREGLSVPIRMIYECPTIRSLAATVDEEHRVLKFPTTQSPSENVAPVSAAMRCTCYSLQLVFSVLIYGIIGLPIVLSVLTYDAMAAGSLSIVAGYGVLAAIGLLSYPVGLILGVIAKWLLIGRYKAGQWPLWGWFYLRFWIVNRFQDLNGSILMTGTPLLSWYFRLMGAKVGSGCVFDTSLCAAFDLVSVGEGTCIGAETHLHGYRVENGVLKIGPITIGERCFIGARSYLGLNARMEDGAQLGDLSLLNDDTCLPANESWSGSPARPSELSLPVGSPVSTSRRQRGMFAALHLFSLLGLLTAIGLCQVPGGLIAFQFAEWGVLWGLLGIALAATTGTVLFCALGVVLKRVLVPHVKPGTYSVCSGFYLRKWIFDQYMYLSNVIVHALYATIFFPTWLRLLGAKVGARSEVSTVSQIIPDLVEIGDECFLADGCRVGGRRFINGEVHLAMNRIGSRTFVGNSAVLPPGDDIGSASLLGVLSISPEEHQKIPDNTEWLGSPSFALPNRNRITNFGSDVIFSPSRFVMLQRLMVDSVRVLLPAVILVSGVFGAISALGWLLEILPAWQVVAVSPLVTVATAAWFMGAVAACKWLLMGRFRPEVKPLWCGYVWWNEVVNGLWETVATPAISPLLGTPFVNWALRLIGIKVGREVYMGTLLYSEFDLVSIGNNACLNAGVVVQTHLFEDRIMKSSTIEIGDNCSIANLGTIVYDTKMAAGSQLAPLSLLMKGESVQRDRVRIGIPTHEISTGSVTQQPRELIPAPSPRV